MSREHWKKLTGARDIKGYSVAWIQDKKFDQTALK